MSQDHSSMENELRKLRAADVDPELIDRLDRCAEGSWNRLTPDETRLESMLRGFAPAAPSDALRARLDGITAKVDFPRNGGIVPMPRSRRRFHGAAVAAAVALCGALAALFVPMGGNTKNVAGNETPAPKTVNEAPLVSRTPDGGALLPAGYSRDLSEASDQGVVWQNRNRPHRVVRVVYTDHITLKDAQGRKYEIEKPRVEYVLVPARTD
ncbi:MAG: hypothetical protein KDN05_07130 [Verrucomicrobiae bacterium]|nr:hypothetical protein [Verrucomicrobiae bacterium]